MAEPETKRRKVEMVLGEIETPFVVLEHDQMKKNCDKVIKNASASSLSLRPHVKTHKTIEGALLQCGDEQKKKIVVSTLAEAAFFAKKEEFRDILFGRPLSLHQIPLVQNLQHSTPGLVLHVMVDTLTTTLAIKKFIEENKEAAKKPFFSIWIKVDANSGRAGVPQDGDLAVKIAKEILLLSPFAVLHGLYTHSGHSYSNKEDKREIRDYCKDEEKALASVVSALTSQTEIKEKDLVLAAGATPTVCAGKYEKSIVNEVHPGNYILFDRQQANCGSCEMTDVAVCVLSRVISHYPDRNTALIDAGGTALHKDAGGQQDWGEIVGFKNLKLKKISQEVGVLTTYDGSELNFEEIPIGKLLMIKPNHSCMTLCNHKDYKIVDSLPASPSEELEKIVV
eukprot:CAMPEP_0201535198 /NCGR_PEP_ID=MMETSP0161_2-20130828/58382_1 /ASSEMBLY_ACC=CAM_ASM_000251 /TAXON_ID=180227 /ORGANISM="Neoparamoeba aestuarina, Strain SoJaBio B1-5/56/2" /LENGTH=394 /DNA_ID=CAMNT_0047940237 /DNA_START=60 /DNA_END=1240 /DNA_ORIENTATION=+